MLTRLLVALLLWASAKATPRRSRRPNILLMFPDELRYDWGGLHVRMARFYIPECPALRLLARCGCGLLLTGVPVQNNPYYSAGDLPLKTPNFDSLARQGVRFTKAVVPAPVCAPSRACLASGREYDPAGQGSNGNSVAPIRDGTFDVGEIATFYQALQRQGYWTMVTGRDDLTKRTGPGLHGQYHTAALGFNDSARCGGSVDATWGECGGTDNGAVPCAGIFANESSRHATIHEPYGAYLATQPVPPAVAQRYNVSNYFELDFSRYAELDKRGGYDSVHWYAIPDTLPFEQFAYQDDWIGRQALALLHRAPPNVPWFLEVSHQAPHPPMDITPEMERNMSGRAHGWPAAYACALPPHWNPNSSTNPAAASANQLCAASSVQRLRHNYAAKIERLDSLLGEYWAAISARGGTERARTLLRLSHYMYSDGY